MPCTAQRTATIGLGLIAFGLLFSGAVKAQGRIVGGWGPEQFCTTRWGNPAPTCAYHTWEQCLATIRATGLNCEVNPFYEPLPNRAEGSRTHRHRAH